MKINKFITAGVVAGVSFLPSISHAITAAHISTISRSNSNSTACQAVQQATTPENMNAMQTFAHNNPTIAFLAFGAIIGGSLLGIVVWAFKDLYKAEKEFNSGYNYKKETPKKTMGEKVKSMRDKIFLNENRFNYKN